MSNYVVCHTDCEFNYRDFIFESGRRYPIVEETDATISIGGKHGGYLVFKKSGDSDQLYQNWFKKC